VAPKWVIWYIQQQKTLRIARERFYSRFKIADDFYPEATGWVRLVMGSKTFSWLQDWRILKSETARGDKACVSFPSFRCVDWDIDLLWFNAFGVLQMISSYHPQYHHHFQYYDLHKHLLICIHFFCQDMQLILNDHLLKIFCCSHFDVGTMSNNEFGYLDHANQSWTLDYPIHWDKTIMTAFIYRRYGSKNWLIPRVRGIELQLFLVQETLTKIKSILQGEIVIKEYK